MGIYLNDEELTALEGLPAAAIHMYVMVLRRRMDFKTGMVGEKPKVSWQSIKEWLYVERNKHGTQPQELSKDQLRRAKVWLEKRGLIRSFGTFASKHEGLKFLCILAKQDSYGQKIAATKPPRLAATEAAKEAAKEESHRDAGLAAIATTKVAMGDMAIAAKHLRSKDIREREGARSENLSTDRVVLSSRRAYELVIEALRAEGIEPTRTDESVFKKLFASGATMGDFVEAARIAKGRGKGFNYMLAVLKNEMNGAVGPNGQATSSPGAKSAQQGFYHSRPELRRRDKEQYFVKRRLS